MPGTPVKIKLPQTPLCAAAAKLTGTLLRNGFDSALVGGCVRDVLLGGAPEDIDIVTVARPEELKKLFSEVKSVGASFGVSLVRCDGAEFEVATARQERNYLDGRHPELVSYTDDLKVDLARRDFTVNAMACNPLTGELLDVFGGLSDLRAGLIRAVRDPEERFGEDHLRMLRAVRFAARLNFAIEEATFAAIRRCAPRCAAIAGERVQNELNRMLTGRFPARALRLLEQSGILEHILPEVAQLRGVGQSPEFHPEGDVLEHTIIMLEHMRCPDKLLAWSVILHDVGKKECFSVDDSGRIRAFNHETVGAELAGVILERLRFSAADREAIIHAVRNHMRFASAMKMRPGKLHCMMAEPRFAMELELHRLDCISSHAIMDIFVFLLDQLRTRPELSELPEPWVRGRDLLAAGLKPSPRFGRVLKKIYSLQLDGVLCDRASALSAAIEELKKHR